MTTPTSVIYGSADTDLNHSGKSVDFSPVVGHELVPIVTMGENAMGLPAMTLPPDMLMLDHPHQHQQHGVQLPPPMQLLQPGMTVSKVLTGVYTVSEETELEAAEANSTM